jgi:gamma-glutamyltranspeptidase/glutathione hydrolase
MAVSRRSCSKLGLTMTKRRQLTAFFLIIAITTAAYPASRAPVRARHGMVASTSEIASQVGADIMKKGGNAVDAAVAVALALAVTWPSAGNLGGGGFMLIRDADGTAEALDYRERAPAAATRDMYLDAKGDLIKGASTEGYRAVGVPGTVAGLALAHKRHGHLPWAQLVEPAERLARDGFTANYYFARTLRGKTSRERLSKFPESRRLFLGDGKPVAEGERFVQPELARTLDRIRLHGADGFYRGETARLLVEEMKAHGGLITTKDLESYEPTVRKPLYGMYRGYEIVTMPPPSSGGIALLEMLNMLERRDLQGAGHNSAAAIHLLTEVMRRAFADRAAYLGDADFVKVPVSGLTDRDYAVSRLSDFDPGHASSSRLVGAGKPPGYESAETTHFTIVDGDGNVVTNTYTLNDTFGSGVTVKDAGFLLNDEMDDFTSKPGQPNDYQLIQGEANAIAPHKRPLSSMTPTIVLKEGKLVFAVGSPGGPTIINTVLQVVVNVIDYGMDIQQAIDEPRVHHQWLPDEIYWEDFGLSRDTREALETMGHPFREKGGNLGDAQGIMIEPETGMRLGASDPRLGGVPVGW